MPASLYEPAVQQTMNAAPAIITTADGTKIPYPFPSPADWRDHWIYFLLVDRFNNPTDPPNPSDYPCGDYQGGNFAGILQQLPFLKEMGVGAIWLSPVLFNPQWFTAYWGGYGTTDFLRIEPRFCSDPARALADPEFAAQEFRSLVDEAHALGIYVIMDIVLNHAGDCFAYADFGNMAPWESDENTHYEVWWRDEHGAPQPAWTDIAAVPAPSRQGLIWPHELQQNAYFRRRGGNEFSGDFGRLRELVTSDIPKGSEKYPVRNFLILAYQYLIAKFDIDGYRIDTLMYVEAAFARTFGNAIREYAQSIGKKNFFTFGEVWREDQDADRVIATFVGRNTHENDEFTGVDAAIDFPLRSRLINVIKGLSAPKELANHAEERKRILKTIISSHGDAGRHYVTFLDNHDLNQRFHHRDFPQQSILALTCLMTLQGIPCIYYGTELGIDNQHLQGSIREYSREALWGMPGAFDKTSFFYKLLHDLSHIRGREPALRYGRQYFRQCSGDGIHFDYSGFHGGLLAFSRILNLREILVVVNTSTGHTVSVKVVVDASLHADGKEWTIIFPLERAGEVAGVTGTFTGRRAVEVTLEKMQVLILK